MTDSSYSPPQVQTCPQCRNILPVIQGYPTWCERCHWNIFPKEWMSAPTRASRFMDNLSIRVLSGLYKEVRREPKRLSQWDISTILAMILSALILLVTVIFLAFGLIFLYMGLQAWPVLALAALCLLFAWVLRPRFRQMPQSTLSRQEYPHLFALIDEVSEKVGVQVDAVVVNSQFDFSFEYVSWKQQRLLWISLPLWEILTKEERIAALTILLTMGKLNNRSQAFLIGSAWQTLDHWRSLFNMDPGCLLTAALRLLYSPIWLLTLIMHLLLTRDSQRTVFLADLAAARVAGTAPTLRALKKFDYNRLISLAVHRYKRTYAPPEGAFAYVQQAIEETPQREFLRMEHLSKMIAPRIDSRFPPPWMRVSLLDDQYTSRPEITISDEDMAAIQAELEGLKPAVGAALLSWSS